MLASRRGGGFSETDRSLPGLAVLGGEVVDAHGDREHERVVLAGGDRDAVGVAHAQDLVIDEERTLAMLVLDPEIVAQRQQLLAQHVAGALRRRPRARILAVSAPAPRWHLRPPSPNQLSG